MIGVVIPYFQRTPGLLARALASVAAQSGSPPVRVYVVDDSSPAPAAPEIPPALEGRVLILRQANGGPGAARNLALDHLHPDVEAVAFLDSDDAWSEAHLARAQAALAAGADLYFADHKREDDPVSRFALCAYAPDGPPLAPGSELRWCDSAGVSRAILRRSPVGTSTVVLRRAAIGELRFRTAYRAAGEDSIFWLEVLERGVRAACSRACDAAYGRGVSVFNNRSWGDARSLTTTLDEMRAQHHFRRRFRLEPELAAASEAQCRRLDLSFCANLLACARRTQWEAAPVALRYLSQRPWALARMPRALAEAVAARRTHAGAALDTAGRT